MTTYGSINGNKPSRRRRNGLVVVAAVVLALGVFASRGFEHEREARLEVVPSSEQDAGVSDLEESLETLELDWRQLCFSKLFSYIFCIWQGRSWRRWRKMHSRPLRLPIIPLRCGLSAKLARLRKPGLSCTYSV